MHVRSKHLYVCCFSELSDVDVEVVIVHVGWETKTKAQGLLANLKTFGFIFTFFIIKNNRGTLKPIAAKLQKKDQDVFQAYSMIDDTIKAVARVRSNREEECHEWFEDASRLADKIDAQFQCHWEAGTKEQCTERKPGIALSS